jgi:hypothetical protein
MAAAHPDRNVSASVALSRDAVNYREVDWSAAQDAKKMKNA